MNPMGDGSRIGLTGCSGPADPDRLNQTLAKHPARDWSMSASPCWRQLTFHGERNPSTLATIGGDSSHPHLRGWGGQHEFLLMACHQSAITSASVGRDTSTAGRADRPGG